MATLNLGRIKPVFRGAYSGSTAYVVDDIVTHGNESFICIQAHGAGTQATSVTAYWSKLAAKGTDGSDGTDIGTTITTQGDILFRDGSGLQRLAKGTANQTLQMNAGATAPNWVTAASGNTVKLHDSIVSTAVNTVSFDGLFTTDYDIYKIYLLHVNCEGSSGGHLKLSVRVSDAIDTSTNYFASYSGTYRTSSASNSFNSGDWQGTTFDFAGWNIPCDHSNQHDTTSWNFTMFDPLKTSHSGRTILTVDGGGWERGDTYTYNLDGMMLHNSASACSGLTFSNSASQNFRDGMQLLVYGIKS